MLELDKTKLDAILSGWREDEEKAISDIYANDGLAADKVRSLITLWLSENELKLLYGLISKEEYDRRVSEINNELVKMTSGRLVGNVLVTATV